MKKDASIALLRNRNTPKVLLCVCLILATVCISLTQRNKGLASTLEVRRHNYKILKQRILATTHDLKKLKARNAKHDQLMICLAEDLTEERNAEKQQSGTPNSLPPKQKTHQRREPAQYLSREEIHMENKS